MYGPRPARNRGEYMNAGHCVFAAIVLVGGFVAELSKEPKSGFVLLLIALLLIMAINLHDLVAHLARIDYRFLLMGFDTQLALVEFAVPMVQASGALLSFLGILFLYYYYYSANVVKVFKMQQIDGVRLKKLRGGAQERLIREREGPSPLILEEERRRKMIAGETRPAHIHATTPYKDVLVGHP
ncbi:hypothetical protein POTOM_049037 [Populus tomentosa]|uniref:Uncharacterized protein n=1 Tax=Populus tomentosa TaxID=118781 RepID=A0A8X8CA17_POPTO|nr:hypothetical protein POTOM_049037 [Populus tomentosa]